MRRCLLRLSYIASICAVPSGAWAQDLASPIGVGAQPATDAGAQPATDAGAQPATDAGAQPATDAGAQPVPPASSQAARTPPDAAAAAGLPEGGADDSFAPSADASSILTGEESPKLELYGFADFSYFHVLNSQSNILRQYVAAYPSFYVGHLNLYLSSQLGDRWRSLAEVRFVYSPTGDDDKPAADGTFPVTDNSATDYGELQRTFSWGGIELQRVWIEYQPFDFLTVRAGQWFTPYGYWNDDHGSPTIIAVHKPFPISDLMFPEKQTGLEAYGKYFIDSTAIGYAFTLSNGRGPYDAIRDLDNNKAIGGRLYLETNALGSLTVGIDAYRGRYTASTKKYRVNTSSGKPVAEIYRQVDAAYEELSLGADLRWLYNDLHVQAEVMTNEAAYDENARPLNVGFNPEPTFAADYRRVGGYVLVGYRTPWLNLMPYGIVEYSSFTNTDFMPPTTALTGGFNLRPTANVVLKAEYSCAFFEGVGSTGAGKDPLSYFGSQVAWAF